MKVQQYTLTRFYKSEQLAERMLAHLRLLNDFPFTHYVNRVLGGANKNKFMLYCRAFNSNHVFKV